MGKLYSFEVLDCGSIFLFKGEKFIKIKDTGRRNDGIPLDLQENNCICLSTLHYCVMPKDVIIECIKEPSLTNKDVYNYCLNDCISTFDLYDEFGRKIKEVIYNGPATIVIWCDGTKTVVKCQPGDIFDKEKGLALCIAKKYLGNKSNFNNEFKKWIKE